MEYATVILMSQTVLACMAVTAAIMWCFFEESPRKEKQE